jgi:hypothetical protein
MCHAPEQHDCVLVMPAEEITLDAYNIKPHKPVQKST